MAKELYVERKETISRERENGLKMMGSYKNEKQKRKDTRIERPFGPEI